MEQKTNSAEELTEDQLRNAGASSAYIAYYLTAQEMGVETSSTRHAEKVVNEGVTYSGGGFHDALWDAEPRFPHNDENPYGADTQNHDILREAGVYQSEEELIA
jgi:hypothetical protein